MNKYTKRYKNFDEFCKEIKTMDELLKWYKANNVQWPKRPKNGSWNDRPMSWPDNLVRTKVGLCWDHAVFMHYFCERNNIPHGNLYIEIYEETENEYWCIGHVIGLYQSENGWNFFNIHGLEETSGELGPYKTADEAIKKYIKMYSSRAYEFDMFNSDLYNIGKKTFWIYLNSDENKIFDRYYNNYTITQTQISENIIDPIFIRKYGMRYPANKKINRSWFEIVGHNIKKWISDTIGKPLFKLGLPSNESGLMGSTGGVMASAYGRPFVSQIMSSTFVRPKYALHDDIFTDNILTTNDDGILQMMSSDYLKDKKVRVFKYVGKNPKEKMNKILEYAGADVYREFIYETLSGKDMINDEQIYIDEDFEEVKFNEIKASIENEAYSVLNKFINMKPSLASRYSIVNTNEASQKLKGHSDSVVIMEDSSLGYFACNRNSMRRTKYYSVIKDIVIGSDIDE